jgi:hypothetical protein
MISAAAGAIDLEVGQLKKKKPQWRLRNRSSIIIVEFRISISEI